MTRVVGVAGILALAAAVSCGGPARDSVLPDEVPASSKEPPAPDPRHEEHLSRAVELYRRGDFDPALEQAATALALAPTVEDTYRLASKMFTDTGRDPEGIEFFQQVAERFPTLAQPWYYKGFHEFHLSWWDDALASFEKAAELDPDNAEYHLRRGLIHKYKGQFDEALEAFERSHELDADSGEAAGYLAEVLRVKGEYDRAESVISDALDRGLETSKLYYGLGQIRRRQGRDEDAEAALRRSIELNPQFAKARSDLAGVLTRLGKKAEADRELARAKRLDDYKERKVVILRRLGVVTGDPMLPLRMGELELTEHRYADALQWFLRAESLGAAPERIAAGRAEAYFALGETARGQAELAKLAGSADARSLLPQAASWISKGDRRRASEILEMALEEGPDDRDFLRRVSDLYARAGDADTAGDVLVRAASASYEAIP